jgi:hypothetical protein
MEQRMKVKMKENYQEVGLYAILASEGFQVSLLEAGEEYLVDAPVGEYLIKHNKAEEVKSVYVKPAPVPEPEPEPVEEQPVFKKRGRK